MGAGTTRRVIASAFLFLAAALAGIGWAETTPNTGAVDSAVTVTPAPALAIEAAPTSRSDAVTAGWSDHRLAKAGIRLGLAVLVGLSVLLAAVIAALARPLPAPGPTLWRRRSVALRAPPLPGLS